MDSKGKKNPVDESLLRGRRRLVEVERIVERGMTPCLRCNFWNRESLRHVDGLCQRRAPTMDGWPRTRVQDGCGEGDYNGEMDVKFASPIVEKGKVLNEGSVAVTDAKYDGQRSCPKCNYRAGIGQFGGGIVCPQCGHGGLNG